ncbi:hypothetical protein ACTD5D_21240 [Nocardia takedensis]|uniref:hypothetical protein n=1 Tax=Nocardia takedensis TaxID=259390 RepID=UPI003F7589E5
MNDLDPFEALREWRDEQIMLGKLQPGTLKDTHIKQILGGGYTDSAKIASMLPRSVRWTADHLARLLARDGRAASEPEADGPGAPEQAGPWQGRPDHGGSGRGGSEQRGRGHGRPGRDSSASGRKDGAPDRDRAGHAGEPRADETAGPSPESPESGAVAGLSVELTAKGHQLRWPVNDHDTGQRVVLYRVTADDEQEPYRPDRSRTVCTTDKTRAEDTEPLTSAVRFVVVWRYAGQTTEHAEDKPPVIVARGHITSPVVGFALAVDHGSVIGQWSVLPKTKRVRVYRTLAHESVPRVEENHRILADQDNLHGFADKDVRPGDYVYQAVSEIDAGDRTILSKAVLARVTVGGELHPVTDLAVRERAEGGQSWLDLTWTPPPGGHVRIHRTAAKPPLSLREGVLHHENLNSEGIEPRAARLDEASVLPNPVIGSPVAQMTEVAWPQGWVFVHLTPVTTVGDQARVGTTVTVVRPPALRDARIVERCHGQFISVSWPNGRWPDGADKVRVHVADSRTPPESAIAEPPAAIMESTGYERDGGLRLPGTLPARGCSVYLVPITYSDGHTYLGKRVDRRYPGLLRIRYEVAVTVDKRRDRWLHVKLHSELDVDPAPPLVFVHRTDRIPLHKNDGERLTDYHDAARSVSTPTDLIRPTELRRDDNRMVWRVRLGVRHGLVRLFADVNAEHQSTLALIDPPLRTLRLPAPTRSR